MNKSEWASMESAPKNGSIIEVIFDDDEKGFCRWSENPVCMLGSRAGSCPPGWATTELCDCDDNLPLDTPKLWRMKNE